MIPPAMKRYCEAISEEVNELSPAKEFGPSLVQLLS
jgi:hypothetical protein